MRNQAFREPYSGSCEPLTVSSYDAESFPPCEYRTPAGRCPIAESIISEATGNATECRVLVEQCQRCVSLADPRAVNAMTVGVACAALMLRDDKRAAVAVVGKFGDYIERETKIIHKLTGGAGSELKKLLSWLRISSDETCNCEEHAAEMDRRGTQWCRENIATIVGWLKAAAAKRRIIFNRPAAYALVRLAIMRAERNERKAAESIQDESRAVIPFEFVSAKTSGNSFLSSS